MWAAIWVQTFKPGSSARGSSIINHWVIFPYLHFFKSFYPNSYECSLPSFHINVGIGDNTKSFHLKHSRAFHGFLGVLSALIQWHSLSQGASGRKSPQIHRNSNQQYLHRLNQFSRIGALDTCPLVQEKKKKFLVSLNVQKAFHLLFLSMSTLMSQSVM